MQVKVGIHESIIDRIRPGLAAKVTLPDKTLDGEVTTVASVTRPAGWWTGNVVKYDTIVELPTTEGLKPGMSAEVEVIMARHENVLMIPTAAVVETKLGHACWVDTAEGMQRRTLKLGDSSDMFIVVEGEFRVCDKTMRISVRIARLGPGEYYGVTRRRKSYNPAIYITACGARREADQAIK